MKTKYHNIVDQDFILFCKLEENSQTHKTHKH
jgi:hypothetical protein